jgi:hypothetical protein
MEVWRYVAGTKAQVSSLGRFCSTRGVVTTPKPRRDGYVRVQIDGKLYYIHRLIAVAFNLPRKKGQHQVNHRNGDRSDNLEWVTASENIRHSFDNLDRESSAPRQSKPVRGRKRGTEDWTPYPSSQEAARTLGLDSGSIRACCRGKYQRTGEYEFEYDEPNEPPLLEGEEWRYVTGTTAQVSSLGRFCSTFGVVTTPKPHLDGYVYVGINGKLYLIHRLIAIAFNLPREKGQDQVNHRNGDRSDNRLDNLEWVTASENVRHSFDNLDRESSAPRQSKPVRGRKRGTEDWTPYPSSQEAARTLGLDSGSISACCRGKRRRTGGYEFQFETK